MLVNVRKRDWIVLPSADPAVLRLRPLTGGDDDTTGVFLPLEGRDVTPSSFAPPDPAQAGDTMGGLLLRDAARLSLRSGAGPFRSLGHISVTPRPYQFVPLIMALRLDPVRLLIADDVGVGKTIEAGMIVRELLDRGEATRFAVICPAHLCDQWARELHEKFALDAVVLQPATIGRLERALPRSDLSIYQYYRHLVVSIDWVKSERNRAHFLDNAPDLIIIDEAHIAARPPSGIGSGGGQHQRYDFVRALAADAARHLILVTATPHSGIEESFRSLLGLLDRRFDSATFGTTGDIDRKALLPHMVQRRRRDVQQWLGAETPFPERRATERRYALSPAYHKLYEEVLAYCRETVGATDGTGGLQRRQQRVRHWAAIALLRCALSSPAAATAVLSERARRQGLAEAEQTGAAVDTDEDVDGVYAPQILDALDGEAAADYTPTAPLEEAEPHLDESERRRLAEMLRRARELAGPEHDFKLVVVADALTELLRDGFRPIVFCRFIATAKYLETWLPRRLKTPDLRVVAVTGEIGDEERRARIGELVEHSTRVLVATDCLSEGINLQEHFDAVLHYDLPWNPNRLEQRFGRIHRFGQTMVCHCWNLVAHETREGVVWGRLLEKLEVERQALGGKVFDVLGRVFEGESLRELLLSAIRYGDDPATLARLEQQVSDVMSDAHYRAVIGEHALAADNLDLQRIRGMREQMERAEQQRLVPHFIAAFFIEALQTLGGTIAQRERERYEIRNVPAEIRRRDRQIGRGIPVLQRYDRVVFDKQLVKAAGKPDAEFIAPGHPLLDAVIDLVRERHRDLLRRGAVLVDPREGVDDQLRALFYVQNDIVDGTTTKTGEKRLVGRRLHFVEIAEDGAVSGGAVAPYLDYRALDEDELAALDRILAQPLASADLEGAARAHAVGELVPAYLAEVRTGREALVRKTTQAVYDRLTKEINYWDMRAEDLRTQEQAGRQPRMNSLAARERRDRLTARLRERMDVLGQERQIAPQAPLVTGGALVVPLTVLDRLLGRPTPQQLQDVRIVERLAMEAVLAAERAAGRTPVDVSLQKVGYDIECLDPETGLLRLIEVKGRRQDADDVTVTRNEMLVALNKRETYYLAVVFVHGGVAESPRYVQDPIGRLLAGDPLFGAVSMKLPLRDLLAETAPALTLPAR